jgi:hypothetical protein
VVVVAPSVVVVGASVAVVVVGSTVVVVGPTVVVVASKVLTGAGWGSGSVVVLLGAAAGGSVAGGRVGRRVASGAVAAGPWAATTGAAPGGGAGVVVVVVEDSRTLALDGATEGAGSVGTGAVVVSSGIAGTADGTSGSSGTRAADATSAARTAKVSPNATSRRRQGRRCSARWRGFRWGMGCCQLVRLGSGSGFYGLSEPNEKLRSHTSCGGRTGHTEQSGPEALTIQVIMGARRASREEVGRWTAW